jgi:transcriptional regulator with XRE-family HTH domain
LAKKVAKNKECVAFGARVRELRTAMGLSQEKFAGKAKMDRTYIVGIETGARNPSLTTICKLAKALKVEAGELM